MQIQLARQRVASAALVRIQPGDGMQDGQDGPDISSPEFDDESIGPSHPDFYPSVALRALTRILRDASLASQHVMVINAMVAILWSLGPAKCLPFLPVVMPLLLHTAAVGEHQLYSSALKETAIEQLGHLISITGLHVRAYLPPLLSLSKEHLHSSSVPLQIHCLGMIEQLCLALNDEFEAHLPPLIPLLLVIVSDDRTEKRIPTLKVLHALETFDQHLQEHLHLIVPSILRLCEQHDAPVHARMRGVWLFGRVCQRLDLRLYASQLVHGMMRVLRNSRQNTEQTLITTTLTLILRSLGPDLMAVFANPIAAGLRSMRIHHESFDALIAPLRSDGGGNGNSGGLPSIGYASAPPQPPHQRPFELVVGQEVAGHHRELLPPASPGRAEAIDERTPFYAGSSSSLDLGAAVAGGGSKDERVRLSSLESVSKDDLSEKTSFGRGVLDKHEDPFGGVWALTGRDASHHSLVVSTRYPAYGDPAWAEGLPGAAAASAAGSALANAPQSSPPPPARRESSSHKTSPKAGRRSSDAAGQRSPQSGGSLFTPEGAVSVNRKRQSSTDGRRQSSREYSVSPTPPGAGSSPETRQRLPSIMGGRSLKATLEATQHSTRADWHDWMRRLSVEMLRESPSAPLRACAPLAEAYQPLARELFNAAFLSCWSELGVEGYQESLVASLETALDTDNMSLEVLQPLLSLAEFMELADKPLPIDIRKLGALAERCHAYAKALHYREMEFENFPADTIDALISINNHLQQPEAAKGILTHARQAYQVELKESWYEKLQRWSDARAAYERRQAEDPENMNWTLGRMRCHRALGDWETLEHLASETWESGRLQHDPASRAEVARLAAAAAWNLHHWDTMERYSGSMPERTVETSLVRAVLAVHADSYQAAQLHIDQARRQLDSEFTALVGESYHRAYRIMIEVLQLTELEEIIQHRRSPEGMNRAACSNVARADYPRAER